MKKLIPFIAALPFIAPLFAYADQASDTIQMPPGLPAGVIGISSDTIANFSPYLYTIAGVILAVTVIGILIETLRK